MLTGRTGAAAQAGTAIAKPSQFLVSQYNEDNGLLQNQITTILPDENGYLWLATESGVQRFDGTHFYEPVTQQELPGYPWRIRILFHLGGDTVLALSKTNHFFRIVHGLISPANSALVREAGLLFTNGTHIDTNGLHCRPDTDWIQHDGPLPLYVGTSPGKSAFIVAATDRLAFYAVKGNTSIRVPGLDVSRLFFLGDKVVYFTKEGDIAIYDRTGLVGYQESVLKPGQQPNIYPGLLNSGSGYFSVGPILYRLRIADNKPVITPVLDNLQQSATLSAIWEKDSNTVIASSHSIGLYVYRRRVFTVAGLDGQNGNSIFYAQTIMPDGETVLTGGDLLFRKGAYVGRLAMPHPMNYFHFFKDRSGYYWFQSDHVLYRTRQPGTKPEMFAGAPLGGIPQFEDHAGRIWLSNSKNELSYLEDSTVHLVPMPGGFNPGYIECVRENAAGDILVGTANGLYTLQRQGDKFIVSKDELLPDTDVRFISEERDGRIWIGTYGKGLYLLRGRRLLKFPLDKDRRLAHVHAIIPDAQGRIWLTTNEGLMMVANQALLNYEHGGDPPFYAFFGKEDGLRSNEFNAACPSYVWLSGSRLSMPSMNGLVQFAPAAVIIPQEHDNVSIDYVRVDTNFIDLAGPFTVQTGAHNIFIHVSTPSWAGAGRQALRYQLADRGRKPLPGQWLDVPPNGTIHFLSLENGDHQLIIRRLDAGQEHGVDRIIDFTVLPPWYRTWWATLLWILAGVVLAAIGFLLRLRYISRRAGFDKLLLEQQLKAMRARLDPHLVQNTFNLLSNRIAAGQQQDAIENIRHISNYLRALLHKSDKAVLTIEEEVDLAREYLEMMQFVHVNGFDYRISIDPAIDSFGIQVPALMLQPFIENAIKYGIPAGPQRDGFISIDLQEEHPYLICTVLDSGNGKPANNPPGHISEGQRLSMLRLETLYAKRRFPPRLTMDAVANGYRVQVFIPLI